MVELPYEYSLFGHKQLVDIEEFLCELIPEKIKIIKVVSSPPGFENAKKPTLQTKMSSVDDIACNYVIQDSDIQSNEILRHLLAPILSPVAETLLPIQRLPPVETKITLEERLKIPPDSHVINSIRKNSAIFRVIIHTSMENQYTSRPKANTIPEAHAKKLCSYGDGTVMYDNVEFIVKGGSLYDVRKKGKKK